MDQDLELNFDRLVY